VLAANIAVPVEFQLLDSAALHHDLENVRGAHQQPSPPPG